jgi:hypothetical protein
MADITREDLEKITVKIDLIIEKVIRLEALQATEADRCPFREEVARASNNVA